MKYLFILLFVLFSSTADSQIRLLKRVKDRAKEKTIEKVNQTADNAVDTLLEKTTSFPDKIGGDKGNKNKDDAFFTSSNFDFKPGTKQIYFADFSVVEIGDFPEKWYTNSSGEIVAISNLNGKWFKAVNDARYKPEIITEAGFPENYTIEFDAVFKASKGTENTEGTESTVGTGLANSTQSFLIDFYNAENEQVISADAGEGGTGNGARFGLQAPNQFTAMNWKEGTAGTNNSQTKEVFTNKDGKVFRVSIWIQKRRGRLYIDKTKVLDIPFFIPEGMQCNAISIKSIQPNAEDYNMFTNLRIAGIVN